MIETQKVYRWKSRMPDVQNYIYTTLKPGCKGKCMLGILQATVVQETQKNQGYRERELYHVTSQRDL